LLLRGGGHFWKTDLNSGSWKTGRKPNVGEQDEPVKKGGERQKNEEKGYSLPRVKKVTLVDLARRR